MASVFPKARPGKELWQLRIFANYEHRILPSVNTKFYLP
jgi:hypothetical protein